MRKAEVQNKSSVAGLAADAGNKMGLLSIQTPVVEMGSYDLSTTMPGIFLYTPLLLQYLLTCSVATAMKTSLEKTDSLILERLCVWCHTILVEK